MGDERRGRPARYLLWGVILLLLFALGPNLAWFVTSTIRIDNASAQRLDAVGYMACGRDHAIGSLRPGESVFRLLPACGDDTLEILVGDARYCRIYVEGEMYHVDAAIRTPRQVECAYDHLLASFFAAKAIF